MLKHYLINQRVIIKHLESKIELEIKHYSQHIGYIKGIKILEKGTFLYLIEFLNHNRIWVIDNELQSFSQNY